MSLGLMNAGFFSFVEGRLAIYYDFTTLSSIGEGERDSMCSRTGSYLCTCDSAYLLHKFFGVLVLVDSDHGSHES
jgi:hypothetical protein